MRNVVVKLAVAATLVGVSSLAQAATTGFSSDTSQVLVGAAGGAHGGTTGSAGIGFPVIMGGRPGQH